MSYIFLDESGDLGFDFKKKGTSRFFIITCLFVPDNKRSIEKLIKKTHSELAKSIKRKVSVLHSIKEKPVTRIRILKRISEKNCSVMSIYLNKDKVHTKLQDEKQVLYNYVANILLDRIYTRKFVPTDKEVELTASRRETNKFLNNNFKDYLNRQIKNNHRGDLKILIKAPSEEKCLQAVDFVSWAIFRKYETGDDSYYNVIKNKILEEDPLFP